MADTGRTAIFALRAILAVGRESNAVRFVDGCLESIFRGQRRYIIWFVTAKMTMSIARGTKGGLFSTFMPDAAWKKHILDQLSFPRESCLTLFPTAPTPSMML